MSESKLVQSSQRKIGIMICGHGSRDKDAEREFSRVAAGLHKRFPEVPIEYGFLEFSAPNIHMGLNKLVAAGVEDIYAVPGMLFAATHARNDIPSVLKNYEKKLKELSTDKVSSSKDVRIHYGSELGLHPAMIEAFQTRILQSMDKDHALPSDVADIELKQHDTMLVVVGRGTSDTLANAEVAKLTRIVNENMGFGWADVVYSGVTYPSVGAGIERLIKLDFKTIVIAPYFLFTGRLIKRIYAYIDQLAAKYPEVTFIKTPYLNDHEKVIDAFEVRLREIMHDQPSNGNETLMESFERRLAAGEVEIHHHHAEFVDPEEALDSSEDHTHDHDHAHDHDHSHSHDHTHSHSHSHGHSHGVYKHIDHPLGPRTMIGDNLCCCFMSQFPQSVLDEEAQSVAKQIDVHGLSKKAIK